MIAPFPTDYQLEQIGKLVLVDRTRPWMLNKYFDAAHFRIIDGAMDQQTLFKTLCDQLQSEGFVDAEFLDSVVEREAIVSTMLGDSIALPHALGLLAKKTVVYTVLAPQGIVWEMRRRTSSFYSPSVKASTKKQWRSTIFLSLSCVSAP
ncbi:BglB-family transcriptional antiterminator [Citrobacter koseri]|nr:BglB-family transcriptional antiterminator [Citrobacter koseri]